MRQKQELETFIASRRLAVVASPVSDQDHRRQSHHRCSPSQILENHANCKGLVW